MDASYNQMYWFHRQAGETMRRLVFTFAGGKPDYESYIDEKYEAVKDNIESGVLRIKNLAPEDSGLYVCAVSTSHSVEAIWHHCTCQK